ncbi:MAG: PAS domain S-box protein [bacterium]
METHENKSEAAALRLKAEDLLKMKSESKILELIEDLAFQNEEKAKRADELLIANKELAFQNKENAKRADELGNANANALKLTHELEVHQIELEILNEELIQAKERAYIAAKKYAELYDNAPTGYFSLSKEGKINELNLSGAAMLGKESSLLKNSKFGLFVSNETKPAFNSFLEKAFNSNFRETCDVTLLTSGNAPVFIHIAGIVTENREQCLVTTVNITGRKLAEKALKENEEKFRTVADFTYDWEYWTGPDGRIIYISPSCERISGYKPEEFLADRSLLKKIVHPGDANIFKDHPENLLSPEHINKIDEFDFRIIRKDGSVAHISHLSRTVFDDRGNYHGRRVSNRDITRRRKMEEELKLVSAELRKAEKDKLDDSESRYRSIFQGSPDGIMITDEQTKMIVFANPAQCEILGYTEDELKMVNIAGIHPANTFPDTLAAYESIARGENISAVDIQCLKKNGEIFYADISASFMTINGRKCIVGFFRDITKRRHAEEMSRKSEEKYKTMLNASPDCMVLTDMNSVIVEVSDIGLHLLGVDSRDKLLGNDIFYFVPDHEHTLLREMLVRTTKEGLAENIGITLRKYDQSLFPGEISITLMQNHDGAPISFMIIIRDISLRKKMEARQIHNDRLTTLGEMAAGIAHEINQPLNIISMVLDRILMEIAKPEIVDVGFLKIKSDKIFENITRIRDIIDHVKAFSSSRKENMLTAFNVNSSIVNATSMIVEQFKHLNIDLNLQLEQHISPIVGNTYKFEQVIVNLLINAKDAVSEKISKTEENFEMLVGIRSWQENQSVFIEVTDNGIGISEDDLQHIMLPFYTTKDEGKGTGLGLSISYQIIREMNGTIEIKSDNTHGTNVKLVLPVQIKAQ